MSIINGFIKSKEVYEVLDTAIRTKQNVVLYGPGGYGKSEMTMAFLRQKDYSDDDITVKALSIASTVDDLYGGINIKKLKDEGIIEYNVDNSIFTTPILVLEEAFDAPKRTLEALKDTLTSGYIRNGKQKYKIKTECIIVCTNRSQRELISDASTEALMERFPLSLKVHWDSHNLSDYADLAEKVFKEPLNEELSSVLSYILTSIKNDVTEKPPAPRTVVRMIKVYNTVGLSGLKYLNIPRIDKAIEYVTYTSKKSKLKDILTSKVSDLIDKYSQLKKEDKFNPGDVIDISYQINNIQSECKRNGIEIDDISKLKVLIELRDYFLAKIS